MAQIGYLWWINSFGGYSAHGFMGQYIIVVPEKKLVAVFTGAFEGDQFPVNHNLVRDFVVKAVNIGPASGIIFQNT